jgi:hypothetical protein
MVSKDQRCAVASNVGEWNDTSTTVVAHLNIRRSTRGAPGFSKDRCTIDAITLLIPTLAAFVFVDDVIAESAIICACLLSRCLPKSTRYRFVSNGHSLCHGHRRSLSARECGCSRVRRVPAWHRWPNFCDVFPL